MKTNPLLPGLVCVLAITSARVFADTTFRVDPAELLITPEAPILLQLQQEGPAETFGLQWFHEGAPLYDDARTTGSQTGTLSIFPSQLEDAGEYTLTFTSVENNQFKNQTVRSSVAFYGRPVIEDIFMETQGASVTFTVIASGGNLSYQWMWQGQDIPGATSNVLKYDDAYASANAGYYTVRVSNSAYPEGVTSPPEALRFTKPTPGGTYQALFYKTGGWGLGGRL